MLGDELLDVIHRYPDHVWVFLHEFPALTAERAEQFRVRRREYEHRVEAVLQAGIDAGEFRDVDPRLTALAWLGMHNYTYLWLKAGGRMSARDVAKPFADIFLRGIGEPGRRALAGFEAEQAAEGAADQHGAWLVVGNAGELRRDQLLAAAERALGVRVVVAPHDRRQPGDVPARDGDRVVLERHVELALHVLARPQRVRPLLVEVGTAAPCWAGRRRGGCRPSTPSHQSASWPMPVTQHLSIAPDQRREPVGVELDEREVQVGEALGDAAADQLADDLLRDDRL